MVDIGAARPATRGLMIEKSLARTDAAFSVDIRAFDEAVADDYAAFCARATHAPAQHPVWVRAWLKATGADAIMVTLSRNGHAWLALALEIVREGPFKVARFMGGSHANGNFAATVAAHAPIDASMRRQLVAALRAARPDVDAVFLERQNPRQGDMLNALAGIATMQSPNVSLAVDLSGGFEATLSRSGAKRKRKKYRLQVRKFEEAGGYRLIEASTPEETERLISDFFVMKAARLRKKGIANVFGPKEIQAFFRELYRSSLDCESPPFILHGVEVAGVIRAVNGVSVTPTSIVCEFGGIRDDDSSASPGYFLDYTNIEQACAGGKHIYDFSVGDEDYKRSWCDVETWQFDTLLPLTAKGQLLYGYEYARAGAVRLVKSNTRLWNLVKRLRRGAAEAKPTSDE